MNAITKYSAMKLRMGATDYFVVTMKAAEAVSHVRLDYRIPRPQSIEEAYQRDINYAAVRNHIAPYLAGNKDRFFGAVIFAVENFSPECFEPLPKSATANMPLAYRMEAERLGFLSLTCRETLIPIDGQHRLKGLLFALEGKDHVNKTIDGVRSDWSIADEDVTVILIPYDKEKSRKIFTAVNRQARPTTRGNLVTDKDDVVPVLAREITNTVIGSDLVKYKSNSLTAKEGYFTTLSAVAEASLAILNVAFDISKRERIADVSNEEKMDMYTRKVRGTWNFLVDNIDVFSDALANKSAEKDSPGDRLRKDMRETNLLMQPVPQICLVTAFVKLTNDRKWKLPPADAAAKLNAIDWGKDSKFWDRVLMSGGKIITKNRSLATDLLCYVAGKPMDEGKLLKEFRACFPPAEQKKATLPAKLK